MRITRIDLADKGSPEALVSLILKCEPNLPVPTPIEELCRQLDIQGIEPLDTNEFEGGLITDTGRSRGIILVRSGAPRRRRRFTIGHELGHFLIPAHMPGPDGRFLCSKRDMMLLSAKENDRRGRMEVEANRFAGLILLPPPALRKALARERSPGMEHMLSIADEFDVSKEATARAYAEYHPEAVAFAVVHEGRVLRCYRNRRFPSIIVPRNSLVPQGSLYHRPGHRPGMPSELDTRLPDLWIDVERGRAAPTMSEQVYLQAKGFALIMLWYEPTDDDEENDERTAKERLRDRQGRLQ